MLRTLLVPALLIGIVATPFLLPDRNQTRVSSAPQLLPSRALSTNYGYPQPVQATATQQPSPFRQASQQRVIQGQSTQPTLPRPATFRCLPSKLATAFNQITINPCWSINRWSTGRQWVIPIGVGRSMMKTTT